MDAWWTTGSLCHCNSGVGVSHTYTLLFHMSEFELSV